MNQTQRQPRIGSSPNGSGLPPLRAFSHAFTLVELMVAIAIIAILAGLMVYGMRSITTSSKRNATRVTLQNAMGMVDEWSHAMNGMINLPAGPLDAIGLQVNSPASTDTLDNRLLLTRALFKRLMGAPSIAKMQKNMPQQTLLSWSAPAPANGTWASGATYALCATVQDPLTGFFYICGLPHTASANNEPGTSGGAAYWCAYDSNNPNLLDAWGNPILFVPATGLGKVSINGVLHTITSRGVMDDVTFALYDQTIAYKPGNLVHYDGGGVVTLYQCQAPVTGVTPGSTNDWLLLPAKPFFASAGPDGDFSTGDDNLYSFEN